MQAHESSSSLMAPPSSVSMAMDASTLNGSQHRAIQDAGGQGNDDGEGGASFSDAPLAKSRSTFKAEDDAILLEIIQANNPYTAGWGSGASTWEAVTRAFHERCRSQTRPVVWRVFQKRTNRLLAWHHNHELELLRKGRSLENYQRVLAALEVIQMQITEYDAEKKSGKGKQGSHKNQISLHDYVRAETIARLGSKRAATETSSTTGDEDGAAWSPQHKARRHEEGSHLEATKAAELELRRKELALQERKLALEERKWNEMQKNAEQDRKLMLSLMAKLVEKL